MLAPCSPCPICLRALQPQRSKPQREVTLPALLPGFCIKPPQSIYLLQGLLSHAARLGKSLLCLPGSITVCRLVCVCVCVRGIEWECDIKRTIVHVSVRFRLGGFHFYLWGHFPSASVLFGMDCILFLLVATRSVVVLAYTSTSTGKASIRWLCFYELLDSFVITEFSFC